MSAGVPTRNGPTRNGPARNRPTRNGPGGPTRNSPAPNSPTPHSPTPHSPASPGPGEPRPSRGRRGELRGRRWNRASGAHFVAERVLVTLREEVVRADTKASILLSAAVAVLVVILSAQQPALSHWPGPLAVFGVVLWTAGVAMLAAAVMPRRRTRDQRRDQRRVRHQTRFTAAYRSGEFFPELTGRTAPALAEELLPRVGRAGREPVRWLVEQSCSLGAILAVKYQWLYRGVAALAAGGLLLIVAWLLR